MGVCPFLTQPYVRIITYGVFSKLDESLCSCCNSSIFPRLIPRQLLRTDTGIRTCTTFSSKLRYLPAAVLQVWVSASSRYLVDFHHSSHIASVVQKPASPRRRRTFRHLIDSERRLIKTRYKKRVSMREIARRLNVSHSTISREIKRGMVTHTDSERREFRTYSADFAS